MTPALALRDIGGIAKRNLLHPAHPQMLLICRCSSAMLLVLFRYVLGGAIHVPGGRLRRLRRPRPCSSKPC